MTPLPCAAILGRYYQPGNNPMPGFRFQGASGNSYDFSLFDPDNRQSMLMQGGIYILILARNGAGGPKPLYIGSAKSLRRAVCGTKA